MAFCSFRGPRGSTSVPKCLRGYKRKNVLKIVYNDKLKMAFHMHTLTKSNSLKPKMCPFLSCLSLVTYLHHSSMENDFFLFPGHRRMHNVTNYFLVNLSTADLMMSCLNTSFNFTFMKSRLVRLSIFLSTFCFLDSRNKEKQRWYVESKKLFP